MRRGRMWGDGKRDEGRSERQDGGKEKFVEKQGSRWSL